MAVLSRQQRTNLELERRRLIAAGSHARGDALLAIKARLNRISDALIADDAARSLVPA